MISLLILTDQIFERLHSFPSDDTLSIHEAKSLLKQISLGRKLRSEDSFPKFVECSILDKVDGLYSRFRVDDLFDARVHLVLDSIGSYRNLVDRFCCDSALRDEFVSFHLVDCSSLHFLLKREVIPVSAGLQSLQKVVFVENGLRLIWFCSWVHFEQSSCGLAKTDDQSDCGFFQAFLECGQIASG